MKNLLIAGNWKSNITKEEAKNWLEDFKQENFSQDIEIMLFVPYTLLDVLNGYIKANNLSVKLGAQNVSHFPKGAHTGEINAEQIKEFADYVLIGHSERRSSFSETDEIVNKKIEAAKEASLKTVVCVSSLDQVRNLSSDDLVIAYEPIEAIGTGNAQDSEEVYSFVSKIKEIKNTKILYGGSVNANNIKNYTDLENINGALIGSESLSSQSFTNIIKNAS